MPSVYPTRFRAPIPFFAPPTTNLHPAIPCVAPYTTTGIGQPHPSVVSEAGLLSSVALPPLTYPSNGLTEWGDVVSAGKLSQLQIESVLYAGQRHQTILPDGRRAGFYIGTFLVLFCVVFVCTVSVGRLSKMRAN